MSMRSARTTIAALLVLLASPWLAAAPSEVWLTAEDEVQIRGDVYLASDDDAKTRPVVLLFHQAGSNRGEYTTIAPRLNALGFHALAIDQRSGSRSVLSMKINPAYDFIRDDPRFQEMLREIGLSGL